MLILQTDRLQLRQFTPNDADFILLLLNTDTWLHHIGDRNVRTLKDATHYLVLGPMKSYEAFGYGLSAIQLRETRQLIGMCGLLKRDNLDAPDIGYALLPEYEGQGYASEIAAALLEHAAKNWGIKCVLAITNPNNERSIRLLEKVGFHFQKLIDYPLEHKQLKLFEKRTE